MKKIVFLLIVFAIATQVQAEEGIRAISGAFLFPEGSSKGIVFINEEREIEFAYQEMDSIAFLGLTFPKVKTKKVLDIDEKMGKFQFVVANRENSQVRSFTNSGLVVTTEDGFHWNIDQPASKEYKNWINAQIKMQILKLVGKLKLINSKDAEIVDDTNGYQRLVRK